MSSHLPHHLKRLQHDRNANIHSSSNNPHSHTNTFDYRSRSLNDEAIRESIQNFTISANNNTKFSRPVFPCISSPIY